MSFFTFTVNCGVTPTPTPTITPTPVPWCCRVYTVRNNNAFSCTINYTTCAGASSTFVVGANSTQVSPCSREGTLTSSCINIVYTAISTCASPNNTCASTPTPLPTSTPTATPTITPTALPTFTVGIYASLQDIPTKIRPPGSGAEVEARMYYSFGYPMAPTLLGGSISSTSCNFLGNITVAYGTVLNLGMLSYSYNSPVGFKIITGSTSCSSATVYGCGILTNGGGVNTAPITANMNIAMQVIVFNEAAPPNAKTFDYCTEFAP